jgi:hypothetical protein
VDSPFLLCVVRFLQKQLRKPARLPWAEKDMADSVFICDQLDDDLALAIRPDHQVAGHEIGVDSFALPYGHISPLRRSSLILRAYKPISALAALGEIVWSRCCISPPLSR